jgi:ABC-type phosphate/phosphonate transport system ATPase subunit
VIRLEKLTIRKLGNIAPNTELHFNSRGALLLGKNGTGKTTLLHVIAAALSSDWPRLSSIADDGFDLDYTLRFSHQTEEPLLLEVTMLGDPTPNGEFVRRPFGDKHRGHTLEVTVRDPSGTLLLRASSKDNQTDFTYRDGSNGQRSTPSHSPVDALTFGDDEKRTPLDHVVFIEELRNLCQRLQRYDEAYDYFERLTHEEREDQPRASFFRLDQLLKGIGFSSDLFSVSTCRAMRDAIELLEKTPDQVKLQSPPPPGIKGEEPLPWLAVFRELVRIDEVSITFELVSAKQSSNTIIMHYGPMSLRYATHGATLRGDQLSFGQKRLFALLHYLDAHESIVLADEMVNGLHHEWIERCLEISNTRQSFLSSQNPILFDFMDFSSAEDAAERFIECNVEEQGRFVWRNMSLDDAAEFYAVYETGVQHVSEILRTRGYW